jgi:hypothetical protein
MTDVDTAAGKLVGEIAQKMVTDAANRKLVAPDDDDAPGDDIQWVTTGVIRIWVAGKRYRIRRPFMGELRTLRGALADATDELQERSEAARQEANKINASIDAIRADDTKTDAQIAAAVKRARAKDRKIGDELTQFMDDMYLGWWAKVFDMLGLDGTPEQWPPWFADQTLPTRVMVHWRDVPKGPG